MAELDEKLNALLSDPGSMAQIVQMAQQLSATMGGNAGAAAPSPAQTAAPAVPPPAQTPPGGIDPQVVARFLPLLQEYSRSNSQTMQLLYALRPFLKESKQDKVERAARLARLIHLGKKFLIDWGDGHVEPVYPGRRRYIHPRQHGGCAAAAAYRSASASPAARHAGGHTA